MPSSFSTSRALTMVAGLLFGLSPFASALANPPSRDLPWHSHPAAGTSSHSSAPRTSRQSSIAHLRASVQRGTRIYRPVYGTIVLGGRMSATNTLTMTGAFSVGNGTDLEWDLPLATSITLNGYREVVTPPSFAWSVRPDSFTDSSVDGNAIRQFFWNNPAPNTVITVTETLRVVTTVTLDPFQSADPYPVASVPADIYPYLQITPDVTLPASASTVIDSFVVGQTSERSVVENVANWVASHDRYQNFPDGSIDASTVYRSHATNCEGYVNLMTGMLRRLGIPVRVEFGWVSPGPLKFPGPHGGKSSIDWAVPGTEGSLHSWLDVYFPTAGWIPFDPQSEKFFVDSRHIRFFTNVDAGQPVDSTGAPWYGAASGTPADDSSSIIGAPLSSGSVDDVPGDGLGSKVTVLVRDHNKVTYSALTRDVPRMVMFSR